MGSQVLELWLGSLCYPPIREAWLLDYKDKVPLTLGNSLPYRRKPPQEKKGSQPRELHSLLVPLGDNLSQVQSGCYQNLVP